MNSVVCPQLFVSPIVSIVYGPQLFTTLKVRPRYERRKYYF